MQGEVTAAESYSQIRGPSRCYHLDNSVAWGKALYIQLELLSKSSHPESSKKRPEQLCRALGVTTVYCVRPYFIQLFKQTSDIGHSHFSDEKTEALEGGTDMPNLP